MKEYSFTLKFNFPDARIDPNLSIDRLYEAGCDDALIGTGKQGCIALDFIRSRSVRFAESAASAFEAVSSAIVDVKKAISDAILIEATPDFVGLTDTAKILGCTRQNIRNPIFNSQLSCRKSYTNATQ